MPNSVLQRAAARIVSSMLGGYGVYCVYLSFLKPWLGLNALIMIGAASAIHYFSEA